MWLALASLLVLLSCGPEQPGGTGTAVSDPRRTVSADRWQEMVEAEELIHALGPSLRRLSRSLENLQLPDARSRELFGVAVEVRDLESGSFESADLTAGIRTSRIEAGAPAPPVAPADLDLFRPLLQHLDHFEHVGLKLARGRFADPERRQFDGKLLLGGSARTREGRLLSLSARVDVVWERAAGTPVKEASSWQIRRFATGPVHVQESAAPLYREVLDRVLADPAQLRRARRSLHEELALRRMAEGDAFAPPHPHFFMGSQDRHPGVSVADVNGDGWDDLYVMARWGPNQLFLADGRGGFRERAAELGLAIEDHSAAAIFADFDNDGDLDAFVGRTLAPSVHLENRDGRFVPVASAEPLPGLVGSLAAADLDADGLLDLYVSTYAAQMIVAETKRKDRERRERGLRPEAALLADHLPAEDAARLFQETRTAGAHEYLELPGPPNLWLRNVGGRFEVDRGQEALRAFRNTYQATFADVDADGDPDLYLAHDFSPNQLLRNEGGGRFVDVTEQTGTADIGFGMGASFGDYDEDGRLDLYVSNMYSKAGRRITEYFDALDPRFQMMARGNSLFRNEGESFRKVSGEGDDDLPVEKAGWSWGGQFTDADNDGFLDLFALSGYYTAPTEIDAAVDI